MLHPIKTRIIKSCKKEDKSEAILDILQCLHSEESSYLAGQQSLAQMQGGGEGGVLS